MAQQNEPNHLLDPVTVPARRKRGRPRKEDPTGTEPSEKSRRRRRNPSPIEGPGFIGQPVSGVLDGVFDAGFLITVRLGSGPPMRGMVFDSRRSVPISATNDVAPHIKMSKRVGVPFQVPTTAEPLQGQGPTVSSPSTISNKGAFNGGSQVSGLWLKASEAVVFPAPSVVPKEAAPLTFQVPGFQGQTSRGEQKLDPKRKESQTNEIASEPILNSTIPSHKGSESPGEPKVDSAKETTVVEQKFFSTSQTYPAHVIGDSAESAGDTKLASVSQTQPEGAEHKGEPELDFLQTPLINETVDDMKLDFASKVSPANETGGELKPGSTDQTPQENETACHLKLDSTGQTPLATEIMMGMKLDSAVHNPWGIEAEGELIMDSASQFLSVGASVLEAKHHLPTQTDSDHDKSIASAVATEGLGLSLHAGSEMLQETKDGPLGNGNSQLSSGGVSSWEF